MEEKDDRTNKLLYDLFKILDQEMEIQYQIEDINKKIFGAEKATETHKEAIKELQRLYGAIMFTKMKRL